MVMVCNLHRFILKLPHSTIHVSIATVMVVSGSRKISIQTLLEIYKNTQLIECDVIELSTDDHATNDSFHRSMKRVATLVQFLFLMPVCGITSDSSEMLLFKWCSLRVIVTLIYISYGAFTTLLFLRFVHGLGINAKNIGENFTKLESSGVIFFKEG